MAHQIQGMVLMLILTFLVASGFEAANVKLDAIIARLELKQAR